MGMMKPDVEIVNGYRIVSGVDQDGHKVWYVLQEGEEPQEGDGFYDYEDAVEAAEYGMDEEEHHQEHSVIMDEIRRA